MADLTSELLSDQKPYSKTEWKRVRLGWWINAVVAVVTLIYTAGLVPVVMFTIWQRPTGFSLSKRVAIALLMTFAMAIPLGALIITFSWSRRNYYLYRQSKGMVPNTWTPGKKQTAAPTRQITVSGADFRYAHPKRRQS